MKWTFTHLLVVLLTVTCLTGLPAKRLFGASLELYGTFQSMGVIVSLEAGEDPDGDAYADVEYAVTGETFRPAFELTRVGNRLIGSLFWLSPGTGYDVRIRLHDPDGGGIDGSVIQGSGRTRGEIVIPQATDELVASPLGSGTACSLGTPCGLTTASALVQPGEAVVLRGGTYHIGGMSTVRSGTEHAPIVFRPYQDELPVLSGFAAGTYNWIQQGDGVYSASLAFSNPHYVMANGERLFPYTSLSSLQTLSRDNRSGFYSSGTTIYVHLAGNGNPNNVEIKISKENLAFHVSHDFIYFIDLSFQGYGNGSYAKALYLDGASNTLVRGCRFEHNDLGVGLKRESHRNVVEDCTFSDTIYDWSWDDVKDVGLLEDGGVVFYDPTNGRGNVIRNNTFRDDFDGFGTCPESTSVVTNETDIYGNTVYNMGDDGASADGRCSNVRIWDNTFHDILMGISLAPVYDGPVYAIRNLIYRTGVGNNNYSGSPFKFNSGYDQSGTMYLFHNTADAFYPGNNGLYIKYPGSWELIYSRNNLWLGTSLGIENTNGGQPVDLDYDVVAGGLGASTVRWSGTTYATLELFSAATGQERHGLDNKPLFIDRADGNYHLVKDQECIDSGLFLPGINDNYHGAAPDLGAYEHTEE